MPHPIYGPPSHELEAVRFVIHLPTRRNGYLTRLEASGTSSTQRGSLWSANEHWTREEASQGITPTDHVAHLLLVALQDRPVSAKALAECLGGPGWEDVPLPF